MSLFCLFSFKTLKAQDSTSAVNPGSAFRFVEFGFRFMPTVSAFSMKSSSSGMVKSEATFGYGIGGLIAVNITKHVGIQGEVLYNSLSQKYKDQDLDREINVKYINFPILLTLNSGKGKQANANVVFGPQFGMNIGSSFERSSGSNTDTVTYVLATKRSDFGFAYGAGLEFMLNEIKTIRLDLGFRGVYGLTNINKMISPGDEDSVPIFESAKVRTKAGYIGFAFLF
jgi:opacity protein-like surface antigen